MSDLSGFIAATHPGFAYCGRVARPGDSYRFDWPNTEIRFSVRGTDAISVRMDGANNFFNIAIDDDPSRVLATGEGVQDYSLSEQLKPAKVHRIRLTKRTEAVASFPDKKTACVLLQGVLLSAGGMLLSESFEQRRVIEFVGDSDTAAYGNLGERTGFEVKDRSVFADPSKQDAAQSWAAMVAGTFGADCHNISYSGMGAVWNAPGMDIGAMNQHYRRLLAAEGDDPTLVATPAHNVLPHVDCVVLFIGGNDWWTLADKGDEAFVDGYTEFLAQLRSLRPTQPLLILLADAFSGSCLVTHERQKLFSDDMKRVLTRAVGKFGGEDVYLREVAPQPAINVNDDADWGLMEHWSTTANAKWGRGVTPLLAEVMGWEPR